MKNYFVLFLSLFLVTAFSQKQIQKLRCIEATSIFPNFDSSFNVSNYDTGTLKIYFLGKKRLYDLLYYYSHTENGILKISEVRRHYVAFDVDSSYGYDLNITSGKIMRVNLDSVFQSVWLVRNKLYPLLTENIAILTESKQNKDSGTLFIRYLIKNKEDSVDLAISTFSYTNKISGIDISLSKELDSIMHMKLYEVETVRFPQHFKENNLTLGSFKTKYSLKEGEILDEKKILDYFKLLHAY